MEPLTLSLAAGFVASFAMDIVKDKGPEYALVAGKALYRRLREDRPPPDRDLQRTVRRAYLRAILGACDACRAELAKQGPSKDAWDVTDLGRAVEGEVRDTRQTSYQLPPWFAVDGIHLVLQADASPTARARALSRQFKQAAFAELAEHRWCREHPQRLVQMIQDGWPVAGDRRQDWFSLLSAAFL